MSGSRFSHSFPLLCLAVDVSRVYAARPPPSSSREFRSLFLPTRRRCMAAAARRLLLRSPVSTSCSPRGRRRSLPLQSPDLSTASPPPRPPPAPVTPRPCSFTRTPLPPRRPPPRRPPGCRSSAARRRRRVGQAARAAISTACSRSPP